MTGYLEGYGAGEERRAKLMKRTALAVFLVLVAGGALYFFFRNFREERRAKLFFELLAARDYQAAYALWGCTPSSPCKDYSMERFMEDWGPQSQHADLSAMKITMVRGCSDGVIVGARFGAGQTDYLWVDRKSRNLGFAPQYVSDIPPVCNPRMSNP